MIHVLSRKDNCSSVQKITDINLDIHRFILSTTSAHLCVTEENQEASAKFRYATRKILLLLTAKILHQQDFQRCSFNTSPLSQIL